MQKLGGSYREVVNLQKDDDDDERYALLHLLKRGGEREIEGVPDVFCAHYIKAIL